jgi:transcriptional regulator with XRE-family HTH domain
MSHWGNVLREARIQAKLTQEQLAAKVPISVSYIRKMETGLIGPPRRDKAEDLADTLNITDPEERNAFFRAAEVGNDEDMEGFRLVKVEDDEVEEEQANGTPTYSPAHPAISIRSLPSNTTGAKVDRRIASGRFTEEEEKEVEAAIIEMIDRFISFKETQRKMQEED